MLPHAWWVNSWDLGLNDNLWTIFFNKLFLNVNVGFMNKISWKYVVENPVDKSSLVQVKSWCQIVWKWSCSLIVSQIIQVSIRYRYQRIMYAIIQQRKCSALLIWCWVNSLKSCSHLGPQIIAMHDPHGKTALILWIDWANFFHVHSSQAMWQTL